jgi:hypothetical protein
MKPDGLYFTCPTCGEDVPRKAKSCPECGACDKTGWSEAARYDGLDFGNDDFDYEEFTAKEFGRGPKKSGKDKFWWCVTVVVLLALVWMAIRGAW